MPRQPTFVSCHMQSSIYRRASCRANRPMVPGGGTCATTAAFAWLPHTMRVLPEALVAGASGRSFQEEAPQFFENSRSRSGPFSKNVTERFRKTTELNKPALPPTNLPPRQARCVLHQHPPSPVFGVVLQPLAVLPPGTSARLPSAKRRVRNSGNRTKVACRGNKCFLQEPPPGCLRQSGVRSARELGPPTNRSSRETGPPDKRCCAHQPVRQPACRVCGTRQPGEGCRS